MTSNSDGKIKLCTKYNCRHPYMQVQAWRTVIMAERSTFLRNKNAEIPTCRFRSWRAVSLVERSALLRNKNADNPILQVQILNNSICQSLYGIITENMMCTSGDNGRGSCYGDSGGPAVVRQPDGTYVQVKQLTSLTYRWNNYTLQ